MSGPSRTGRFVPRGTSFVLLGRGRTDTCYLGENWRRTVYHIEREKKTRIEESLIRRARAAPPPSLSKRRKRKGGRRQLAHGEEKGLLFSGGA